MHAHDREKTSSTIVKKFPSVSCTPVAKPNANHDFHSAEENNDFASLDVVTYIDYEATSKERDGDTNKMVAPP